ncbi:MAG: type II toxin-antitoxin system RelE/ParE family toxin [Gammaproteobacteria bacterium]|nr:type II toxin-antitoxin system RelE/ParE family toxin [Gammaproteobacteria bacterium]
MAAALIWSSESLDDIDALAQFIGRDSPRHAQRVVEALFDLGDAIAAHPLAGRVVPELGEHHVRERFLYSYRIIYEIRPERIEVLAVLHGRRLLESIGERFEE